MKVSWQADRHVSCGQETVYKLQANRVDNGLVSNPENACGAWASNPCPLVDPARRLALHMLAAEQPRRTLKGHLQRWWGGGGGGGRSIAEREHAQGTFSTA